MYRGGCDQCRSSGCRQCDPHGVDRARAAYEAQRFQSLGPAQQAEERKSPPDIYARDGRPLEQFGRTGYFGGNMSFGNPRG